MHLQISRFRFRLGRADLAGTTVPAMTEMKIFSAAVERRASPLLISSIIRPSKTAMQSVTIALLFSDSVIKSRAIDCQSLDAFSSSAHIPEGFAEQ